MGKEGKEEGKKSDSQKKTCKKRKDRTPEPSSESSTEEEDKWSDEDESGNWGVVWSLKMKSRCYPEKNGIKLVLVSNEAEFLVEQHSQNPQKSSLGNLFYECLNICLSASFKASLVTIVQAEM